MSSFRRSSSQSTRYRDRPIDESLNLHWACSGTNLAVLTLPGPGEEHLVAKRVRRKSDGASRGCLYYVQTDVKGDPVERLDFYTSVIAAQMTGEDRFERGEFLTGPLRFPTQRWCNGERFSARLIIKMNHFDVHYRPGMTVGEATDLVVVKQINEIMRHYFARKRAA